MQIAKEFDNIGRPFMLETSALRPGHPNLFELPELKAFREEAKAHITQFVQCHFGALSAKPTRLMHKYINMPDLPSECHHPRRWWVIPWSRRYILSAHPPLIGTQRAIPAGHWEPEMKRKRRPRGAFISRAAAMYTTTMNEFILCTFHGSLGAATTHPAPKRKFQHAFPASKLEHMHGIRRLQFTSQPKGRQLGQQKNTTDFSQAVGGMRNTFKSMAAIPGHLVVGSAI